jgi:hypothetical protein
MSMRRVFCTTISWSGCLRGNACFYGRTLMNEPRALAKLWAQSDASYFKDHPDRESHIRLAYSGENEHEFFSLGPHATNRRRILLWKMPKENQYYDPKRPQVLKIPFLAFADETIEDRDDILLPILAGIMENAAKEYARPM